jgi:hypothetical protein
MMSLRYTGEATMDATALRDVERDVERWKDKVEVRLDNRQVFFLFFGSAMVACMLFVLGVIVGKRLESRGRAQAPVIEDPLAALDRFGVEGAGSPTAPSALTFPRALLGGGTPAARSEHPGRPAAKAAPSVTAAKPVPAPTTLTATATTTATVDSAAPAPAVNKKLAALPRPLAGQKAAAPAAASSTAARVAPAEPSSPREADVSPTVAKVAVPAPTTKAPAAAPATVKVVASAPAAKIPRPSSSTLKVAVTGAPTTKGTPLTPPGPKTATPVVAPPRAITGSISQAKVVILDPFRPTAPAPLKATTASSSDAPAKGGPAVTPAPARKGGFMLQLSSFQDRAEADAFARRFAAQNAYVSSSEVPGKGTVYRVRVGSYGTMKEAANAKTSFEHDHNVIAYVAGSGPAN